MEPVEFTGFLDYLNRNQRVEVVTTDRLALNAIQQLLPGALRHATPRRDAVANATTLGEILVTTNRRSFVIGITDAGFALESRVATDENTFLSCGLAAVCDWILTNAEKAGISQEVRMHHLSPEGTLEEQRFYWMQVQSRFGDKSADGTDSSTIGAPKAQEEKRFERDKSR